MARISITDGSGKWFDDDKAELFRENTYHDGRNWISKATRSQWNHEFLYLTAGGRFVLNKFSDVQGGLESYEIMSRSEALEWFLSQGFQDDEIPEILHDKINDYEV